LEIVSAEESNAAYPTTTIRVKPSTTKLAENAEQIHTIDTSIQYVMETLDLKASRIVAHPRHYKYTIPHVSRLFKKPWEWIEYDRETWRECAPQESE